MTEQAQGALALFEQIQQGTLSPQQVVEQALGRIDTLDKTLGAFNFTTSDLAYRTAEAVAEKLKKGEKLPLLAGVPLALKDNINLCGIRTTCSSKILENNKAAFDATVSVKLAQHLIPIVGKTNLDEFAMGGSTENSAFGPTRNPWDIERVPGGSSGGSAAAVASGQVPMALGSDTGGSIRQPAAFCGIVGIKPTYGLVSRYGLVAFASSLDQIGPFAANVRDTAALLQVISGFDPLDSTSLPAAPPVDYLAELEKPLSGLKVGYIEEFMQEGALPADIRQSMESAIETFRGLGAAIQPISLPHLQFAVAAYYIIAPAEASSNLARYDGVRYGHRADEAKDIYSMYLKTRAEGFGPEVKRRIMIGTFALSAGYYDAYYGKAQQVRELIKQDLKAAFAQVDLLIGPTSPLTAFKIGEKADDPVQMYLVDIATIPANLAGIPALSLPCGFDQQGLPIGLHMMGPHLSEALLLQAAYAFESQTGLKNLQPKGLASLSA